MSGLAVSTLLLCDHESEGGAMESCYKLYTWLNHTILMLMLQILWKMSQISDFFKEKSIEKEKTDSLIFSPLTSESKQRRHIRSMSDVQSSTPYRLPYRSRKGSIHSYTYDSDSMPKRTHHKQRDIDSSDSSDCFSSPRKMRTVERRIIKHIDSMRIL